MYQVEEEHVPPWSEPFSAFYWRLRMQSYLLVAAFGTIAVLGYWLYDLGTNATSLVYVVGPDGEASAVMDREANRKPTQGEALHVAKRFVRLLYAWNSSSIHLDLAEALTMASPEMQERLRLEFAESQFVDSIREQQVRSEVDLQHISLLERGADDWRVSLKGNITLFPLTQYDVGPLKVRPLDVEIVLANTPRNPVTRLNGLEVVHLQRVLKPTADRQAS